MAVRVAFFIITIVVVLVSESKLHFFQYKIMMMVIWNGLLLTFSIQVNPAISFLGIVALSEPYFKRQEKLYAT